MTGKQLVDLIQTNGWGGKEIFVESQGYVGYMKAIEKIGDGLVLGCTNSVDWNKRNIEEFYSTWYNVVELIDAMELLRHGKTVFLLRADGRVDKANNLSTEVLQWEYIHYNSLFGTLIENPVVKTNKENGVKTLVTMQEAIRKTEEAGYWKAGTVKQMLEDGQEIWTPYATYKLYIE